MADNKRFVSYMYEYRGDDKGSNAGYTRVDARGSQCKILVHISQQASSSRLLKAYMFYRKPGKYRFAYLGNIRLSDGIGEIKVKAERNNIMNSDLNLEEFGGVVVYDEGKSYYACEWDEKPITHSLIDHIDNLDLAGGQEVVMTGQSQEIDAATKAEEVTEAAPEEASAEAEQEKTIDFIPVENLHTVTQEEKAEALELASAEPEVKEQQEEIKEQEPDIQAQSKEEEKIPEAELIEPEAMVNAMSCEEAECIEPTYGTWEQEVAATTMRDDARRYECHPAAQNIFRKFPRIYPFEDYEICDCVRIEPKDIGLFPIDAWVLGNNSFLLHGYYTYKHLIFGKINSNEGIIYVLGVPGIYQNRESFMARMFGFEYFKCAKATERKNGEFGYYYQPIVFR